MLLHASVVAKIKIAFNSSVLLQKMLSASVAYRGLMRDMVQTIIQHKGYSVHSFAQACVDIALHSTPKSVFRAASTFSEYLSPEEFASLVSNVAIKKVQTRTLPLD